MHKPDLRHRDYTFPLIIIATGVVWLLINTGVVSPQIWTSLSKFWPLILILMGANSLIGNSTLEKIVKFTLTSGTITFVLLVALLHSSTSLPKPLSKIKEIPSLPKITEPSLHSLVNFNQTLTPRDVDRDRVSLRQFNLKLAAGKLQVSDKNEDLYARIKGQASLAPELTHKLTDGTLNINLNAATPLKSAGDYQLNLGLNHLPTSIFFNTKVGATNMDLQNTPINAINGNQDTGSITIKLSQNSLPETLDLSTKVGSINLSLPKDTALEINATTKLGSVTIDGDHRGSSLIQTVSGSTKTVKLNLHTSLGSITITRE